MSASPIRRRHRLTAPLVGAVLALGLLAGCTGQSDPDDYGAGVKDAWMDGCVATAEADAEAVTEGEGEAIRDPETFCECAYEALSDEETGLDFSTFKEVNSDLRDEPGPLPEKVTKVFADCVDEDARGR